MKNRKIIYTIFSVCIVLTGIWYSSYVRTSELTFAKDNKIYYDSMEVVEDFKDTIKEENIIDINTATIEELMLLDGIGEKRAQDIVYYRENISKFEKIEDIKNIKGIGDKIFENIKDFITVRGDR